MNFVVTCGTTFTEYQDSVYIECALITLSRTRKLSQNQNKTYSSEIKSELRHKNKGLLLVSASLTLLRQCAPKDPLDTQAKAALARSTKVLRAKRPVINR